MKRPGVVHHAYSQDCDRFATFSTYKKIHILHVNPSGNSFIEFPLTGLAHEDLPILRIPTELGVLVKINKIPYIILFNILIFIFSSWNMGS